MIIEDWSGGPGFPGPVPIEEWGDTFLEEIYTDYMSGPGTLRLDRSNLLHDVLMDSVLPVEAIRLSDVDLDGDSDIVLKRYRNISWFENFDGAGIFWLQHYMGMLPSSPVGGSCSPADLDGDGDDDIMAYSIYMITWFENIDGGSSWQEHQIPVDGVQLSVAVPVDVDGDGDLDVVYFGSEAGSGYAFAWIRNETGTWSAPMTIDEAPAVFSGAVADLDSDGDVDLLGKDLWYENNGSGTSWVSHEYGASSCSVFSAFDADLDGDLDVLAARTVSYQFFYLVWFENLDGEGTDWHQNTITECETSCSRAMPSLIDSDEYVDTFFLTAGDGLGWARNSGDSGVWQVELIAPGDPSYNSIWAGNINPDGNTDIAFTHDSGLVGWYDLSTYRPYSCLTSSIAYAYPLLDWWVIDCTGTLPPGTSAYFRVRCSDDPDDMGDWSDNLYPPFYLWGYLPSLQNYFQYQLCMETSSPYSTPVIESVSLSWGEMDVEEDQGPDASGIILERNPLGPGDGFSVGIMQSGDVDLRILDLCGRSVSVLEDGWKGAGIHSYEMPQLPFGIYILTLDSDELTDSRRIVLVGR